MTTDIISTDALMERRLITITCRAGAETDGACTETASSTLWIGRKIGRAPIKCMELSAAIPAISAGSIPALDTVKLAAALTDVHLEYIRRVKCQRLNLGDKLELHFPADADEYATSVLNLLTSPAQRAKKLVSGSSIRAALLSAEYKHARDIAVAENRRDAFIRIVERELLPLVTAADAVVATERATVRDTAVVRLHEIVALLPDACQHKEVLAAAADMLAELPTGDLSDAI